MSDCTVARGSIYPPELVIQPISQHKHTFIILQCRGSSAENFGLELLASEVTSYGNLAVAFPHAKVILPTASKRRAVIYKRSYINQWFDNWHLHSQTEREEVQYDGLRESSTYIHCLLQAAVDEVGAENVVPRGLSQGCAASLVATLTWGQRPFAVMVGMCGWLPLRSHIEESARSALGRGLDEEDDPFAHSDSEDGSAEVIVR